MSVDVLTPRRQELLSRLLAKRAAAETVKPVPREESEPLSAAQRRVLFASQLDGGTAFHTSFALRLTGELDLAALRHAIDALVRRHESLRTTFLDLHSEPRQRVHATMEIPLRTAQADTPEEAQELAALEATRPFDLATGPLMRFLLLRLGPQEHVLHAVAHHVILDGWSVSIALRELSETYSGQAVAPPALHYADFARWEAAQEQPEASLAYWREALAQPRPALELPFAATARHSERQGAKHHFLVRRELLAALPSEQGTTLFVTLLTAFKATLARYCGEYDLTIGTVLAGRRRAEIEPVIGNFINMLALRTQLDPRDSFLDALRKVRSSTVDGFAHQDVPFERVVQELAESRDPNRHPLFQVAFNLHNFAEPHRSWNGLTEQPWAHEIDDVTYDLAFVAVPSADGVDVALQYRSDLIAKPAIQRFAGHFLALLASAAAQPTLALSELNLLTEAEKAELQQLSAGPVLPLPEGTVLDQILRAGETHPGRTALIAGDTTLTYRELLDAVTQRSAALRAEGIGPGDVVGVSLSRTADLLIALLAIWHTGAAYLPLDPSYPDDRLAFMLEDSAARLLPGTALPASGGEAWDDAGSRAASTVPCTASGAVIEAGGVRDDGTAAGAAKEAGSGLAYVMYTSGSTGKPKGVLIEHRSLLNFILAMRQELDADETQTWVAQTSLSFDISTLELFLPLTVGGTVVLAGDEAGRDGAQMLRLIREHGVTHVQATPSGWRVMLAAGFQEQHVTALVGGEALPEPLAGTLRGATRRLINVYGPTETTVWSTSATVTGPVTIGRPIANTWAYVLDEAHQPVAIGLAGELYLGGDGVARGYHERPELTAERFLPNPFHPGRMYRTGDRVRWRADGELEFIGRLDNQVKVRGHRIELGEIEAALTAHPNVRVAAVVVRPDASGEPALVAYTVGEATGAVLKSHLAATLPAHLVPSAFVGLSELPLTPNGKLDRKALPAPAFETSRERTAPRTPMEQLIAVVWAEVLGLPDIGVHDDFFERGGHSLLAARVIARLRDAAGIDLPLRELFAHPTIEGLARVAASAGQADSWAPDPNAAPVLSYGQERLWFMDQFAPDNAAYIIAAGLRIRQSVDPQALQVALNALADRHEPLRSRFAATATGEATVSIAGAGHIPLEVVAAEDERHAHEPFTEASARPFDLATGPVARAVLIRIAEDDHALLLAVHHIASDGWSTEILLRELTVLLDGGTLPPMPARYRDYAAWQRDRLATGTQLDYWREQLADVPALELPTDRARPAEQTFNGAMHHFALTPELTEALHRLSREHRSTLYMTLLAAFDVLLYRYTGQKDFAIGSPVAGRPRAEWEGLAGLFINMLTMRANLHDDPAFAEVLKRTRETALAAYAHGDIPFEFLVKELNVPRDVSRSPLFQAVFALHNYAASGLESFGGEAKFTRFELGLYFTEREGRLDGSLAYNTALFDDATAQQMTGHLIRILEAVTADAATPIGELRMLAEAEADQIINGFNDIPVAEPAVSALHHVLQGHDPQAPAITDGITTLSYGELDRRSSQVAHYLLKRGVTADTPVAIKLAQTTDIAVAIFGVLKAGGAYLPVDSEQPAARLADLLTGIEHVLSEAELTGTLSEPDNDPDVDIDPSQLAYVIFTSGSTGKPKGVAIAHAQILNYLAGVHDRFRPEPGSSFGLIQSLAFDFGITTFYLCFLTGGCLHLLPKHSSGQDLAARRVDYFKLTPSHLAALAADVSDVAELLPHKMLILGGEASQLEWARSLVRPGGCEVWNHYGPTETTVGVTTYHVTADGTGGTLTPIGQPLSKARLYVLDEHRRPVPVGVVGEVYIGGDRLARGYLGRPDLTEERFVPDPFTGHRMYRTGDQGRWLPSGDVEFLGRQDNQIKIRGYRVELGEIEAALNTCPGVVQSVVDLRDGRLVAYLTGQETELRHFLTDRLPDYMVPSWFVWLDALPLKAHGKVDKALLPAPDQSTGTDYVAPAGPVQVALAEVFAEVLEVAQVGVHDDFFALGGHSLLAIGVVARTRRRLAPSTRQISVLDVFKSPTVAGLAALIERGEDGPRQLLHELTPRRPRVDATIVTVPYGGASAVVFQPLADALPATHRLLSVAVPGHDIGFDEEQQPLDTVARRCAGEILERVTGPLILYGHCGPGGALTVAIAQLLEAAGRPLEAVYLGGVFPFAAPSGKVLGPLARLTRMDRLRNDQVHANWLRGLGADLDGLDESQIRFLIRTMREDARMAESYFTGLYEANVCPISAPVISVVGERDPSTEFYAERFAEWGFLTTQATAVVVLDEAGHFFLRYRANELADIITSTHQSLEKSEGETWWVQDVRQPQEVKAPTHGMGRFLAVAAGQLISMTGTALTEFALPIWIYLQTGSLVQFALFFAIGVVPGLLAAPVAGAVADRFDRRKVMLAGDLGAGSIQAVLLGLVLSDALRIGHVYVLLAALSAILPFQRVAYQAAVPQLVPKRFLGHANGINQMLLGTGQLMVPLFAAGMLAGVGLKGILLIDVISYTCAVILLLFVKFPPLLGQKRRETFRAEIAGGFRYSIGKPGLRAMVLFFVVFNLFFSPLSNMIAPLVLGYGSLADVAYVSTAAAIGVIGGGLLMTVWGGPRQRRMTGMLLAVIALGVACALTGVHPSVPVAAAGALAMTFSLTVVNGIYTTIVQVKVEQRYHARVFALNMMVAWSTLPIGIALLGPLAVVWLDSIGLLYQVFGGVIVLIALVSLRLPVLSRFDTRVPDALPDDEVGLRAVRARLG
ncbi:non-ribosomal peptide synthetase/MFS transporter [Catelliglobosispora koreensis]|uniref:non-ribosomal peptide synthetase/MFS transporter n=1 Tax=Catelliglobosispora koreensis TaxID=129052 RepID=UPI0003798D25|nr:non-ribosomal peptide synthetase/MFS transporter [Catelliglobosispora koreensis]